MVTYSKRIAFRPAIAMIELIFSIVIMGIVLMSAPMLISQASNSGYTSTQQESIAAVASHMALVLSRHWDENNTQIDDRAKVLDTTTDANLITDLIFLNRAGVPRTTDNGGHRTGMTPAGATVRLMASPPASFGQAGGEDPANETFDDIDDYHNTTVSFIDNTAGRNDAGDYIENNLSIATTVAYMNANNDGVPVIYNNGANTMRYNTTFTALGGVDTSNIKHINVRFQKNADTHSNAARELDKDISFDAFSCNIGSYTFESREF